MKIKVIVEDVGFNHAKVEIEENCGIEELRTLMDRINCELTNQTGANPRRTFTNGQERKRKNNYNSHLKPPSHDALEALRAAAMFNGTDIESVCRDYDVDPKQISSGECWKMTNDLNERSGYSQRNPT